MSVFVVVILRPDLVPTAGDTLPNNAGAWVQSFETVYDACFWVENPYRETYFLYGESEEAPLVIADKDSRVLLTL
jgi:hypothetical protein